MSRLSNLSARYLWQQKANTATTKPRAAGTKDSDKDLAIERKKVDFSVPSPVNQVIPALTVPKSPINRAVAAILARLFNPRFISP